MEFTCIAFMGLVRPMWQPCECPSLSFGAKRKEDGVEEKSHWMVGSGTPPHPHKLSCFHVTVSLCRCTQMPWP